MRAIITMICAVALIVTFTTQSPADAKTFRWGYQGDAAEMDYQARRETFTDAVIANMMEGMIRYNGKLELEPSLADIEPEANCQFERTGYFCLDGKASEPGKPVFNRTVTLRDSWAKRNK